MAMQLLCPHLWEMKPGPTKPLHSYVCLLMFACSRVIVQLGIQSFTEYWKNITDILGQEMPGSETSQPESSSWSL